MSYLEEYTIGVF